MRRGNGMGRLAALYASLQAVMIRWLAWGGSLPWSAQSANPADDRGWDQAQSQWEATMAAALTPARSPRPKGAAVFRVMLDTIETPGDIVPKQMIGSLIKARLAFPVHSRPPTELKRARM